uniref:EF-hand domain-containing protein n=2 Tax=Araucaria cunninghamii TaxID=56994 RepID=A0A0D6R560_ARACU
MMRVYELFYRKALRWLKKPAKLMSSPSTSSNKNSGHACDQTVKLDEKYINASTQILRELEEVFKHFDANGDGKISISELGAVVNSLGNEFTSREELEMMIREVDCNGDGFIDLQEFIDFNVKSEGGGAGSLQELRDAFRIFDADRNGYISAEELRSVLANMGDESSLEECFQMIKGVDLDGDGFINFEEFAKMMSS